MAQLSTCLIGQLQAPALLYMKIYSSDTGKVPSRYCVSRPINSREFKHTYILQNCNRVKKNQTDAQLILGIFCQPLHISSVSRPIIRRYNRVYTTIDTYYFFLDECLLSWLDWNSNPTRTTDSHLKRISTKFCINTVVSPDERPRYGRNMYRLTRYTKHKLCIKLVCLYTIVSRRTVNKT